MISNSVILNKAKTRILHQHDVWERNYRDCGAKVQHFFDICKYFARKMQNNFANAEIYNLYVYF